MVSGDLGGLMFGASDLESETFGMERLQEGKDLGVVEGGSEMEGSLERRMTSEKSDVAEADFGKAGCGGGSELNSESCELLGESSGSKDMCHHPDDGQNLTTTEVCKRVKVFELLQNT